LEGERYPSDRRTDAPANYDRYFGDDFQTAIGVACARKDSRVDVLTNHEERPHQHNHDGSSLLFRTSFPCNRSITISFLVLYHPCRSNVLISLGVAFASFRGFQTRTCNGEWTSSFFVVAESKLSRRCTCVFSDLSLRSVDEALPLALLPTLPWF
jgi:hypothetical protein